MDLPNFSQNNAIRLIFFLHLLLVVWSIQSELLPLSYFLYNALFFIMLLWSLHSPVSGEPLLMATITNLLSILLDAIVIAFFTSNKPFGFGTLLMLIINILFRPISSLVLLHFYNKRSGRYDIISEHNNGRNPLISSRSNSGGRSTYENIDDRPLLNQNVTSPDF